MSSVEVSQDFHQKMHSAKGDISHPSCSTYERQKHLPNLQCRFVFHRHLQHLFHLPSKWDARLLSGEELIFFLFEVDTVVLFKAGCEGHFSLERVSLHD